MSSNLFIGLMSGTSMDAVDCALVDLSSNRTPGLLDFINVEIDPKLKQKLVILCHEASVPLTLLGECDVAMGRLFASAAQSIIEKNQLQPGQVSAIGSHGQTVYHQPPGKADLAFSLQIADPNTIAALTGITTVADFRRKDMAYGGQGAPLLPAYHQHLFKSSACDRIILNIGGMANITLLRKDDPNIVGFDTGPGNILLDCWIQKHKGQDYDQQGQWAATGSSDTAFLDFLIEDSYFASPPPKSTGREYFNLQWLEKQLDNYGHELAPEDVQSSLIDLTASSISKAIQQLISKGEVLVCGGGARNTRLMQSLKSHLQSFTVTDTNELGINSDALEAIAFAWFAKQTLEHKAIDLSNITGSTQPAILGGVYYAE